MVNDLTPLQLDAIRVALQFHGAIIQQTLEKLQPPAPPREE